MIIRTVSASEYYEAFPKSHNAFTSQAFIDVTAGNAEAVRFFIGFDEGFLPCMGIVAGYSNGEWHAPYSAPFSGIDYIAPQPLESIYDFISELTDTLSAPLHITLPPDYYDPQMLTSVTGILANYARAKTFDFDFYYPISTYGSYLDNLDSTVRDRLRHALDSGFKTELTDDLRRASEVIRIHRETHSYRPAMDEDQLKATIGAVKTEMFMLTHDGADIAAAIVLHVADGIVRVACMGDMPGYDDLLPMNLLAYRVFGHYASTGIRIVDMGEASTAGIPNTRQCRFKGSVGCRIALTPTFVF